jgi:hypothetical protein
VSTQIQVLGLRAGRTFTLRADAMDGLATWSSEPLTYTTAELPTGWPQCTPTFDVDDSEFDPDEAVCTSGTFADGHDLYFCTDHWGEPVFAISTDDDDSLLSMEPLMDGSWATTSYNNAKVIFFDATGREVHTLTPSSFAGETRFDHEFIDAHEMYQIRDGKWRGAVAFLTDSFSYEYAGGVVGNGLVVIDPTTYDVLYDYSFQGPPDDGVSMDPLVPYTREGIGDFTGDWLHANAILHGTDDDGREYFLVSLRAQDWIVKLYPDTDELAWALGFEGNFTLVDDIDATSPVELDPTEWPYHMHGMTFVDAEGPRIGLVLFDNGYPRHDAAGPNWNLRYSRFVQMDVDQDTALAQLDFTYGRIVGPDHFFSSTCGNVELLPDGQRAIGVDGESDTMIEVSYPEGQRRWSMTCDTTDWCTYQVHWFPNLYERGWSYD